MADPESAWAAAAAIRGMSEQLLEDVHASPQREDALVHLGRAAAALERVR